MSNEQQQNNSLNVEDGGESSTSSSSSCNDNCIHCPQNITILFEGDEFRRYLENHITNYKILRPNIHIQLQEVVVSSPSTSTSNTSSLYGGSELSNAGESLISYVLNGRNGNHDNNNHGNDKATWDGILFPAHWIGELVESNILWDLSDYVQEQLNVIAPSPSRSLQDQSSTITATIDNNQSLNLDWPDIQPFIRSQQATFNGQVLSIPLDGDIISLYYNRDLFDQHQIQVPKTWEEYLTVAQYFHGKPWGPNGTSLHGSCISRLNHCANYYWTALILSTMTQSTGSGSGFLLHPTTVDPLLGDAMMETLKIVADQSLVGPNDELPLIMKNATTCMEVNYDLNSGTCAMTYNWGNQIGYSNNQRKNNNIHNNNNNSNNYSTARNYRQQQQRQQQKEQPNIGVAPTPGSTRVLNRNTYQLEDCTPELCPYGIYYDDIGRIVNRPSYSAFGGWQGGVSHTSPTRNQYAVADFFSYMSYHVQSFYEDVVPNNRSTFVNPYRYSHLMPSSWNTNTTTTSLDTISALQFTDSVGTINSQNTVMDIRIRPGKDIRTIIDEEVYDYLMKRKAGRNWTNGINSTDDIDNTDDDEEEEDALVRKQVTARMDGRIQQIIASSDRDTVLRMYQASLGITNANTGDLPSSSQPSSMNGIDPKYRSASWGVSGLICCTSLALILWTLWYRRNKVMQAFQPYLLIQCAVGLFFMGATIIPLGLDDTIVTDTAILDVTCMASPWIYVVGFSLFFSSIYSKIRLCIRIFHSPEKNDVMAVQPMNALKGSVRVLLLNSVILFLWTLVDPLQWVRVEVPDGITYSDGTVETYGACRGDTFSMLLFVLCLFFLNLILCLIGIYQAFQCRFLILEYNEMQWLPLSIFPFFEAWVCGCPILFFVQEDPTTTFLVLTIVISVSCIASALAVFAPKDWYVRKFRGRDGGTKGSQITSRSTPAGVLVLKHPTVESRKQIVKLQTQLERVTSYNTELVIDIRVLKEKFRHLTRREKLAVAHGLFGEEMSADGTANSRSNIIVRGGDETENTPAQEDELAAMEHFASVWSSMPDDDDIEDDGTEVGDNDERNIPPPDESLEFDLEIAAANTAGRDTGYGGETGQGLRSGPSAGSVAGAGVLGVVAGSTSRNQRVDGDRNPTGEVANDDMAVFALAAAGCAFVRDSPRVSPIFEENSAIGSSLNVSTIGPESNLSLGTYRSNSNGVSSFDEDNDEDDLRRLGKEIELDDLDALEAEALALAEQFKLTKTFLESISDINADSKESQPNLHDFDISKFTYIQSNPGIFYDRSEFTATTDELNETSSSTGVDISASAGESSGGAYVSRWATLELMDGYSSQNAGEPSGDINFSNGPRPDNDEEGSHEGHDGNNVQNDYNEMKPPLPPSHHRNNKQHTARFSDQGRSSLRSSFSSASGIDSPLNGSNNNISVMIADWSAVGATGGLLADLSDSQSTSSYAESYADSFSSMEQATARTSHRSSHVNVPLAKEIDQLVAQADFDAVVVAAQKFEVSPMQRPVDDEDEVRNKKIAERKRKKRELEAWKISLSRSFEKDKM